MSIILLGIKDGTDRNKRIKEAIRSKIKKGIYRFTDEELSYLDVNRSELPVRGKNTLRRAGVKYLHEILCLDNPLELKGMGENQLRRIKEYIRIKYEL